jgi:hypothetical protein
MVQKKTFGPLFADFRTKGRFFPLFFVFLQPTPNNGKATIKTRREVLGCTAKRNRKY